MCFNYISMLFVLNEANRFYFHRIALPFISLFILSVVLSPVLTSPAYLIGAIKRTTKNSTCCVRVCKCVCFFVLFGRVSFVSFYRRYLLVTFISHYKITHFIYSCQSFAKSIEVLFRFLGFPIDHIGQNSGPNSDVCAAVPIK